MTGAKIAALAGSTIAAIGLSFGVFVVTGMTTVMAGLWGMLPALVAVVLLVATVVRAKRTLVKLTAGASLLFVGAVMAWIAPEWWDIRQHDRAHGTFASAICSTPPPSESQVLACAPELQNESQGNHCQYAAVLTLRSTLDSSQLEEFYADSHPDAERVFTTVLDDGVVRVDVLSFHKEQDLRCL